MADPSPTHPPEPILTSIDPRFDEWAAASEAAKHTDQATRVTLQAAPDFTDYVSVEVADPMNDPAIVKAWFPFERISPGPWEGPNSYAGWRPQ